MSFTMNRYFHSSLTITSRPLTLSCKRRLYVNLLLTFVSSQTKDFSTRLLVYSPIRRQSLNVFHILISPLVLRTFAAKHPLFTNLRTTVDISSPFNSYITKQLLFHHSSSLLLFLVFATIINIFSEYSLGHRALGVQSN